MPIESKEPKTTPETAETLEQRIEKLEKENAELRAENEKLKSKADQWNLKEEIVVNRLYRFWKSKLDKTEVDSILKNLNGEYKNKIEDFIKNDKIEDLQKYLNSLIDSWAINKDQLVNNCREKWIWLRDWHIFEDGKFWPQTFEAIKLLSSASEWWSEDGNKDNGKDWAKDKWKDDKENADYDEIVEWRDKRLYKVKKLTSLDDLPKDYKWPIPSNYEKWKEETYATVYHVIIKSKSAKPYIFYGNGTCRSPLDDQIYGSKAIVEKLKNGRADEKEYWKDVYLHMQTISQLLEWDEFLLGDKKESIWANMEWNKVKFYLKGSKHTTRRTSQGDYVGTTKTTSSTYYDYYTYLSAWDLLDKNWKFDKEYFQKVLLKQVKNELVSQYNANSVMQWLINVKKKWYTMDQIFSKEHQWESKYLRYFNEMDRFASKVTFDDIRRDGKNIKFSLDNGGSNKDYNKLTANYTELADNKGKFSEEKLKQYLKKKIEEIVEKHF